MEPSSSITASLTSLFEAVTSGDGDAIAQQTTAGPGLVFIGTDPDEWFEDLAPVRAMLEAQAGAGVTVCHGPIKAYEEGTVGWAADQGHFVLPDGSEVPFRVTAVFHREDGSWKLVQEHASVAMPNEEVIGTEL